jgi:UDP:flavonoid glycosyltransferase YjiC (YdhE family)
VEGTTVLGRLIWEPANKAPDWLDKVDPAKPAIYVTLGSTGDEQQLPRVVNALSRAGYQVLVTTGGSL